jgi:hypothetical protein
MYKVKGFKYSGHYDPLISDDDSEKDYSFDIAFLELNNRSARFIYRKIGYSGVFFNAPSSRFYKSFGYPEENFSTGLIDIVNNGERLRSCFGSLYRGPVGRESVYLSQPIITNCNLGHGSSGGAKILRYKRKNYLVGINSFIFGAGNIYNNLSGAARLSSVARALWQAGFSYRGSFANPIWVGNSSM